MRRYRLLFTASAAILLLGLAVLGALPASASAQTFTDVRGDEWFAPAVYALADRAIVYGHEDGTFGPNETVTRGELAVYLDRIIELQGTLALPFADVSRYDWYAGSVAAMYEAGLISGTSANTFSPNLPVSRQQAAAFLMRSLRYYLERQGLSTSDLELADYQAPAWLAGFRDRDLISPQQAVFVANAYRLGIMEGATDGWLYPALILTRAQLAAMLYRAFMEPVAAKNVYPVELPAVSGYPTQSMGSKGVLVQFLESRLTDLHYPCGDVDGVYDNRTRDAVMAFEKVERLPRDGVAGAAVWQRIFGAETPTPHLSAGGYRVEVDLTRQVLFMIDNDQVWKIVHVSTGRKGTITGHHAVGMKQEGWVRAITVNGMMYYPSYIVSKTAIHGFESVPPYPASHGCIRTPVWMAQELYFQLPKGTPVDVFY
ncbi:MAG: hypothetical protein A2133_08570 [Actinobacteria bacterium RBG_16_64_13]|nr:MAG: hypothetical protein A2133_08570 [Actinobacteria bacterium RBG_16_64_13]